MEASTTTGSTISADRKLRLCIFCYRSASIGYLGGDVGDCGRFLKFLERLVAPGGRDLGGGSLVETWEKNEFLVCCVECGVIISSFCEVYHQLKCLELELEWKLGSLVDIMTLAGRVPSRTIQFRKMVEENQLEKARFSTFRNAVLRKCSYKLSKSEPRIRLKRKLEAESQNISLLSPTPLPEVGNITAGPVGNDESKITTTTSSNNSSLEHFLGWAFSTIAVATLTTPPTGTSTSPLSPREIVDFSGEVEEFPGSLALGDADKDVEHEMNPQHKTAFKGSLNPHGMPAINSLENTNISTKTEIVYPEGISMYVEDEDWLNNCQLDDLGSHIPQKQEPNNEEMIYVQEHPPQNTGVEEAIILKIELEPSDPSILDHPNKPQNNNKDNFTSSSAGKRKKRQLKDLDRKGGSIAKKKKAETPSSPLGTTASSNVIRQTSQNTSTESPVDAKVSVSIQESLPQRYNLRENRKTSFSKIDEDEDQHENNDSDNSYTGEKDAHSSSPSESEDETSRDVKIATKQSIRIDTKKQWECEICKISTIVMLKTHHFRRWHDTKGVDPQDILKCTIEGCPAYFVNAKYKAHLLMAQHMDKAHETASTVGNTENSPDMEREINTKELENTSGTSHVECNLCPEVFSCRSTLREHKKKCHGGRAKNTFACPVDQCEEVFNTELGLENHQKLQGTFNCKFCDTVKEYAPDLALHESDEHSIRADVDKKKRIGGSYKTLRCSRCLMDFSKKSTFFKHFLTTHLNLSRPGNICTICQAEGSGDFLKKHIRQFHRTKGLDPSQIIKCDKCPAYFVKPRQLYIHTMLIHYKKKCPERGKHFPKLRLLRGHMKQQHPNLPLFETFSFACNSGGCGRRFETKEKLECHRKEANHYEQVVEQPTTFQCSHCGKVFQNKFRLASHINNVHAEPTFICAECGKGFRVKAALQRHLEYHEGPETWKEECPTCKKTFVDKYKLKEHMRIHTNEKPYVCQFCEEKYAHRHNWRNHVMTKHENEFDHLDETVVGRKREIVNKVSRKGTKKGDFILAGVQQK